MTMVSFMRIFSGRGAENTIFRRRQILAVFDEAQDYHLFQALGMASLVDAAIFLQDKQQTFQRTDAGVMDREQNYWASLFGAYSNILRELTSPQAAGLTAQAKRHYNNTESQTFR